MENSLKWYLKEIEKYSLLTKEEERELLIRYKKYLDMEARQKLIESNLRLVVSIAKGYSMNPDFLLDLIQAGNEGLIKAVDTFDVTKKTRLSTYAFFIIYSKILFFLEDNLKIEKISHHKIRELYQYQCFKEKLEHSFGRKLERKDILEHSNFTLEQIKKYEELLNPNVSLDEDLSDLLVDDKIPSLDDIIISSNLRFELASLLNELTEKQKLVLVLKYGLLDGIPKKEKEIAFIMYQMGINETIITTAGVSKLHQKSLKKLRPLAHQRHLEDYLA